jgi:cytosine/adenosine deaminase-related metal-dependent hydrolase
VHPRLLSSAAWLSFGARLPVAFHLAESREELQLLREGEGPLRDLLVELDAWQADAIPLGTRPLDYLKTLLTAHRALVIHGNYLDDDELDFLAANSARMSVVYCPRTHDRFGHGPYPLARMQQRGVSMALGTDSRASNPDLNLWEELRFVSQRFSNIPLSHVLALGTLGGAKALGIDRQFGTLEPGKRPGLIAVELPSSDEGDAYRLLFE